MDRAEISDQIIRILHSQSLANKSQLRKLLEVLSNNLDSQAALKPDRVIRELYAGGEYTITEYVTPSANGTFVVDIYGSTDDETTNYNLEISCYSGTCPVQPPPPVCTLKDSPSYNASTETLTMTFTLATPAAATWNTWLTTGNTMQTLWSQSKPITEPAVTISKTKTGLPKSGKIGILSTLTTTTAGITCSSWTVVNTGTP
jgi:hypothetical protein